MSPNDILHLRLSIQGLSKNRFSNPHEVVNALGAVQAQDFPHAKWGIGLRLGRTTNEKLDRAYNAGKILRTHVMRPTWHFVSPTDIRWMQMLTGPRVSRAMGSYNHRLGLNANLFSQSNRIIEKALKGENYLTRQELKTELKKSIGTISTTQKLAHIVMQAEVEGLICSGPLKGKQFTYGLIEERAPKAKEMDREKALEELVVRYFSSHGPATVVDMNWWSGLSQKEINQGIKWAGSKLQSQIVGNNTYWFSKKNPRMEKQSNAVFMLPNYDEYTIGYRSKNALYLPSTHSIFSGTGFYHTIVEDGKVIGMWKRITHQKKCTIQTKRIVPFTKQIEGALENQVRTYGDFFGIPTHLD